MKINLDLPHTYEVEVLEELPGGGGPEEVIYYPGASRLGGGEGLMLSVVPEKAKPWVGIFAFGYESSKVFHGVMSCPIEDELCVVSSGLGVMVSAENPDHWQKLPLFPLLDVRILRNKKKLLFHNFTHVAAWDEKGLQWRSEKVSSDGLKITELNDETVTLEGWSAPNNKEFTMRLNLEDGKVESKDPGIADLGK